MSIIVNGASIPINGDYIVVNGVKVEKVIANGVVVWKKETKRYIWDGSTLYSGAGLSGFYKDGGKLVSLCKRSADEEDPIDKTVVITGIDLTGYSKLKVTSDTYNPLTFGASYVRYGVDSASQTFVDLGSYGEISLVSGTLDVAQYTGVHNLTFYQYARNDSSYEGSASWANLGITEILLEP